MNRNPPFSTGLSGPLALAFGVLTLVEFLTAIPLTGAEIQIEPFFKGVDVSCMDLTANPCLDFYQYANGNWIARNPIPPDQSIWDAKSVLIDHNQEVLHQLLDELAKDAGAPKDSNRWKLGEYYRRGMDTATIEAQGIKALAHEFARIDALRDKTELAALVAHFHRRGVRPAFLFWVSEDYANSAQSIPQLYSGGLGVPDREVYLKVDEQSDTLRKSYQAHVDKMFQLLGDNLDAAAAHAGTILSMETCLARASSIDPYSGTQKIQLAGLSAIAPSIDWSRYFSGIGLPEPGGLNVSQPTFFKSLARIVETNSLDDWKTYLRWHLINATADKLNREFEQEHFNFYGRIMVGAKEQKPRWKRMVEATDSALGFALGQIYVERAVQPVTTARVKLLVANIRASLRDRISSLEWMGDSTRAEAIRKLDAMVVNIGYPDKWRDYSMLAVDQQSLVLNALQANEFAFQRRLNKIGKPVDRTDWDMTPPTVSAFYTTSLNRIEFPAGILQPPFFDSRADDASNYGAIGTVIGHELTHGFDNSNRQYDADGNWRNWWTAEDEKTFNLRAQLVERQFNEYVPLENLHINGKMTLGENIADLGGLRIAWIAFQRSLSGKPRPIDIDGFTPEQRFFLAYAQIWRSNMRPEAARLWLATNPHSPARQRLLGPLSNMPEFAWAFGCAESNSFLRSESLRVRIW